MYTDTLLFEDSRVCLVFPSFTSFTHFVDPSQSNWHVMVNLWPVQMFGPPVTLMLGWQPPKRNNDSHVSLQIHLSKKEPLYLLFFTYHSYVMKSTAAKWISESTCLNRNVTNHWELSRNRLCREAGTHMSWTIYPSCGFMFYQVMNNEITLSSKNPSNGKYFRSMHEKVI